MIIVITVEPVIILEAPLNYVTTLGPASALTSQNYILFIRN